MFAWEIDEWKKAVESRKKFFAVMFVGGPFDGLMRLVEARSKFDHLPPEEVEINEFIYRLGGGTYNLEYHWTGPELE